MKDEKKNLDILKNLGVFSFNDETIVPKQKVISSGSLLLNKALGIEGWPVGKIIEIFGVDSSGKTTLALHATAEAQKEKKTVLYLDLENTLNSEWSKKIGVNLDNLLIAKPESGEKAFELINKSIESNLIDLVIVDSVASLVPSYEFESSIEDQTMGLHARLMSKGLRIMQSLMTKSKTTVIFINQIRDKIGGNSYLPATTTTGGRALKYAACVRVEVKKCETIRDSNNEVIGFETRCIVVKNKNSAPLTIAKTAIYFDSGFDMYHEVISELINRKVITRKGAWLEYEGKNIAQGFNQMRRKLKENEELFKKLKEIAFPSK